MIILESRVIRAFGVLSLGLVVGCSIGHDRPAVFYGAEFDFREAEALVKGSTRQEVQEKLGLPFEIRSHEDGRGEDWLYLECGRQDDVIRFLGGVIKRNPIALWKTEAQLVFVADRLVTFKVTREDLLGGRGKSSSCARPDS